MVAAHAYIQLRRENLLRTDDQQVRDLRFFISIQVDVNSMAKIAWVLVNNVTNIGRRGL